MATNTGSTAITLVTGNHTGNTNTDQIVLRQSEAGTVAEKLAKEKKSE